MVTMNRVLALQKHKMKPDDNFAEARQLLAEDSVLIPCANTDDVDLQGGYRIGQINEIFTKRRNATETNEEWMFVQLYKLMMKVQDETAQRQVSEARNRLLALMLGLGQNALDTIEILDISLYPGYPRDATVRFCAMAQDVKAREQKRATFDAQAVRSATILPFNPEP